MRSRRVGCRFSLRTLLILITLVAVLLVAVEDATIRREDSYGGIWVSLRGSQLHGVKQLVVLRQPGGAFIGCRLVNDGWHPHPEGVAIGKWKADIWKWEAVQR